VLLAADHVAFGLNPEVVELPVIDGAGGNPVIGSASGPRPGYIQYRK